MLDQTRVTLIDDDQLQLDLTSYQLGKIGFSQLRCFVDARAALSEIELPGNSCQIIILDLNMPDMDGLEFLEKLQRTQFNGSLLLLSGEDERILESAVKLAQAYDLDVLGHLQKPTTQNQLRALLSAPVLEGRTRLPARDRKMYSTESLQQAINNGELFNLYQPKVSVATGELVSVEALARWQHPEDGTVYPDQFIELAERSGLIDDLARNVLDTALKQLREWKDNGLQISMAVNLSMDNLSTRSFMDFVSTTMAKTQVRPEELILELTESKLMRDYTLVLDILTRLRLRHVNLSIDDFGTGHSSIAQLRDIPFNELKIDRGFVHCAWVNPTLKAIFLSNVQLARDLGIKTVAEGVEDDNDWEFLKTTGCDVAQGYFISRPLAATRLLDWRASWQQDLLNL